MTIGKQANAKISFVGNVRMPHAKAMINAAIVTNNVLHARPMVTLPSHAYVRKTNLVAYIKTKKTKKTKADTSSEDASDTEQTSSASEDEENSRTSSSSADNCTAKEIKSIRKKYPSILTLQLKNKSDIGKRG